VVTSHSTASPKPGTDVLGHYVYDEGNWRYTGIGGRVFAFQDEGEMVTVHVAAKRRYGIVEDMDELTYENLQGAFAV
jgi:hypothetical protein